MNRPRQSPVFRPLRAGALLAAACGFACLPGCMIGALVGVFGQSLPIKAAYEIPKEKSVVVIVDDFNRAAVTPGLCQGIASAATYHLEKDGGFKVVATDKVQDALAKLGDRWVGAKGQKPVSAASLGAALHADLVVYANVTASQVMVADQVCQPQVQLSVKVYSPAGACLFPAMPDGDNIRQSGFVIESAVPPRDLTASGRGAAPLAESKLTAQAGLDLAQLFYDHQPQDKYGKMGY